MANILIIDEEDAHFERLSSLLSSLDSYISIYRANNLEFASVICNRNSIDIFIFNLPVSEKKDPLAGINLGISIRGMLDYSNSPIIYISRLQSNITKAINLIHCYGFLLSTYHYDDLRSIMLSALQQVRSPSIIIKDTSGVNIQMQKGQITFIESKRHQLTIHCLGTSYITSAYTLSSIIKVLDKNFIRCHKSYVINKNYVKHYDQTMQIIGITDRSIPVGRVFKPNIDVALAANT